MKHQPIFLLFIFAFAFHFVHAQDTLVKVNHERLIVKVNEVDPDVVKYKLFSSPDGPVYVMKKDDIKEIIYADGHVDIFSSDNNYVQVPAAEYCDKWMIGINAFDFVSTQLTADYEFSVGKASTINIGLSSGLNFLSGKKPTEYNSDIYYYDKYKRFSIGADLRFYPYARTLKPSYFLGPYFEYGENNYVENYYNYPNPVSPVYRIYWYSGVGITNGILLHPSDEMFISFYGTLGLLRVGKNNFDDFTFLGRAGIVIGFSEGKIRSPDADVK